MGNSRMNAALDMYFDMVDEHEDIFGKSGCGYEMCLGDRIVVTDYAANKRYVAPDRETPARFIDRIQRSIQAGRNLFFEEWESVEIDTNLLY